VSKERLFELVFPGAEDVQYEAIEVVAYRLRKKLAHSGVMLVTLRGLGYLLKARRDEPIGLSQACAARPASGAPLSLRRYLLLGILLPVGLFVADQHLQPVPPGAGALHTAYDRTLLASAKSSASSWTWKATTTTPG
jgi:hypothetical protein